MNKIDSFGLFIKKTAPPFGHLPLMAGEIAPNKLSEQMKNETSLKKKALRVSQKADSGHLHPL